MYPAAFEYVAATSFDEAVELLARLGSEAKLLAGGCSLIPLMKLRLAEPTHLIDLNRVPDAAYIREAGGFLRIGALARESDLENADLLRRRYPILVDTSGVIADPTIRNMSTIGGNLAHGDPANDHPATMLALRAELVVQGPDRTRTIPADAFFVDLFQTALEPAEVLTEIRVPAPGPGTGGAYVKFERQVGDFAIAGAAAVVRIADGRIAEASIGLTNVGSVAIRARAAESVLLGASPDESALRVAADAARAGLAPWGDLRGSSAVKTRLAGVAAYRALRMAVERALGGRDV